MMNVLFNVNNDDFVQAMVMLTSLLENTDEVSIYCIESSLDGAKKDVIRKQINRYNANVKFISGQKMKAFCKGENAKKAYHILALGKMLEDRIDRILFVSNDSIINSNIDEFYSQDFGANVLVARAQTINDKVKRIGERPEKGQMFDTRVLLVNIVQLRTLNIDELVDNATAKYGNIETTQGVLNCIFEDKTKCEYRVEYNFRHSIYSEMEKAGLDVVSIEPAIVSYEKRDYYCCDFMHQPWELVLNNWEARNIQGDGYIFVPYDLKDTYSVSCKILSIWKRYMLLSSLSDEIKQQIGSECAVAVQQRFVKDERDRKRKQRDFFIRLSEDCTHGSVEIENIKYKDLVRYIDSISREKAIDTMQNLFKLNQKRMRGKRVKVGFVVYSSSEWQCEYLYRKLENDNFFEPMIILNYQNYGEEKIVEETYENTKRFFEDSYRVVSLYREENEKKEIIDHLDIIVYISPFEMEPSYINILERNINQLCVHIPYAYYLVSKEDMRYGDTFFDRPFFKVLWKYFVPCEFDTNSVKRLQRLSGYNVVFSGFPKMDEYLGEDYAIREDIWKVNVNTELRLIWAPHFNMARGMNGTFRENYLWFFEYAKSHSEISWVVKPHPRFKAGAIEAGIFSSKEEVDQYINEWNQLDNATVVEQGEYYDIFEYSDAMILDSISFIAEYQFTGKPLLFLLSPEPRKFGDLGEALMNVIYKTRGNDFGGISEFINNCKMGKDVMANTRKSFFDEMLNYEKINKATASDSIYNEFASFIKE